ncbi:MAG: tyrosine-type recombinase/integrase, partial [Actinobacteria bacterium]|nr:tyrosine-type recombinase/integrase [Actinomycetota bacterium]
MRAYRGDLGDFGRFFAGPIDQITAGVLRDYLGGLADKAPATRARREAALASLLAWAYRAEMIAADPMTRLDRTRLPASLPRPVPTEHIEAVLRAIPKTRDRDRLLFLLLYTTGMRVGEALTIEIDDLDLRRDDEHVTVLGKGGRRRTVLLDDSTLVALLRRYLTARGYRHGSLFRAEKNYVGGPLRYASVQELWAK